MLVLPVGIFSVAIGVIRLLFRKVAGNQKEFWLILLVIVVYAIGMPVGFPDGVGAGIVVLILNVIIAIPGMIMLTS